MPCIGRDQEIRQIASILMRTRKNMPVLVGDPGVGKTAVVHGFAQYLQSEAAPRALRGCTVIEFPVALFSAGHGVVGEVQQVTLRLINELRENPNVILFLDELHQVIGEGRASGTHSDVAQILKPALAAGDIRIVGATTRDEYSILEKDSAFERRMNPVLIEEPSPEDALVMIQGLQPYLEHHYQITN